MRVLIIGGQGFIGSHLVHHYKTQKAYVTFSTTSPTQDPLGIFLPNGELDFGSLFKSGPYDLCIHAAGGSDIKSSVQNPKLDHYLNVTHFEALLKSLSTHSPRTKVIHLSSAAVYGQQTTQPLDENSTTQPCSPYGQHKLQAEQLSRNYDLPLVNCRIFSTYGPNLRKQIFWDLYQKSKRDTSLELYGKGEETRDYIFIDDLLQAMDHIVEKAHFQQESINIGNGEALSLLHVTTLFLEILNSQTQVHFNGLERKGDPKHYCADPTHLKSLGYEQKFSMQQGLSLYQQWLENV